MQSYSTARQAAAQEAVAVTQLFRTTALLPEPASDALRGALACYGRATDAAALGRTAGTAVRRRGRRDALSQRGWGMAGVPMAARVPATMCSVTHWITAIQQELR